MKKHLKLVLLLCLSVMVVVACSDDDEETSTGAAPVASARTGPAATPVSLSAFSNFACTSNWTHRDGALGLAAGSGSGTCQATFPGVPGVYRVTVRVQTEFDGSSPYQVMINGGVVHSGAYPLASPLGCDCPLDQWRSVCPDRVVDLDAGAHQINTGDVIGFWGQEVYPCGSHGSYAKWHAMIFTPVN
jgi:hypothetical protein